MQPLITLLQICNYNNIDNIFNKKERPTHEVFKI